MSPASTSKKGRRADSRGVRKASAKAGAMLKPNRSRYYAPALEKGLDILEALAKATVPQTLADLARSSMYTPSQIFRMVDTLERRSYIVRDSVSEGYELTLMLYRLAHSCSPVDQLLKAARLPMKNLTRTIHESCHLSVLSERDLLVVAEEQAPNPVRLSVGVGYHISPLNTASGQVLLAFLDPEERTQFLDQDRDFSQWQPARRHAFQSLMGRIRRQGFLVRESTARTGLDVACFVGSAKLGLHAAVGVPVMPGGCNSGRERELIPAIEACTRGITASLGLEGE